MENHLYTCCGSPAYAAPELISGKEYLGAEVFVASRKQDTLIIHPVKVVFYLNVSCKKYDLTLER